MLIGRDSYQVIDDLEEECEALFSSFCVGVSNPARPSWMLHCLSDLPDSLISSAEMSDLTVCPSSHLL